MTTSHDVKQDVHATVELAKFCADKNIEFMYMQAPFKICKYDDAEISGILDFSNQRADDLLAGLSKAGVKNYDFRKMLHDEGKNHHELFYKTDHHWKYETGLWASRHILRILREDFKWPVDENVLDEKNFEFVTYPASLLGSYGRKLTTARVKPEDFTLLYPKIDTDFMLNIPGRNLNLSGDFTIFVDEKKLNNKQEYIRFEIATFGTVMNITNKLAENNKKVLMIRRSFAHAVIPFLAMGVKYLDSIGDFGDFNGSIKSYIEQTKPDLVIVLFNPSYIRGYYYIVNNDAFDFR